MTKKNYIEIAKILAEVGNIKAREFLTKKLTLK